jgi:hypothetical protein
MAVTLLPSSNEDIMGLVEKHSAYSKPLILFFYEDPHLILKSRDPEKYYGDGSLCHLTAQ